MGVCLWKPQNSHFYTSLISDSPEGKRKAQSPFKGLWLGQWDMNAHPNLHVLALVFLRIRETGVFSKDYKGGSVVLPTVSDTALGSGHLDSRLALEVNRASFYSPVNWGCRTRQLLRAFQFWDNLLTMWFAHHLMKYTIKTAKPSLTAEVRPLWKGHAVLGEEKCLRRFVSACPQTGQPRGSEAVSGALLRRNQDPCRGFCHRSPTWAVADNQLSRSGCRLTNLKPLTGWFKGSLKIATR